VEQARTKTKQNENLIYTDNVEAFENAFSDDDNCQEKDDRPGVKKRVNTCRSLNTPATLSKCAAQKATRIAQASIGYGLNVL
jgi:hypothetical protein